MNTRCCSRHKMENRQRKLEVRNGFATAVMSFAPLQNVEQKIAAFGGWVGARGSKALKSKHYFSMARSN